MKKLTTIFLLCAGMLLSLAGCQEKPVTPDGKEGKLVEFAAVAGKPATRTAFSGEGTGTAGNLDWERIDWVKDDPILIWSDNAHVRNGGSGNAATYTIDVIKTSSDGKESRATLSDPNGTGLVYKDGVSIPLRPSPLRQRQTMIN